MSNPYITFALGEASVTVGHPNPAEQLKLVAAIQEAMRPDEGKPEVCPGCGGKLEHGGGNGVEYEEWDCNSCGEAWTIRIDIERDWESIQHA